MGGRIYRFLAETDAPSRGATTRGANSMAIYYLDVKTGSRANGQSARAKAHYILREGRYAKTAAEVLHSTSGHMPGWVDSAADYWTAADLHERANGRLFKELVFALPIELPLAQQIELAEGFARRLTEGERLPYTLALHAGDGRNPHCHLAVSERVNDDVQRPAEQWFRRYNRATPDQGGARKSERLKPKAWLEETREAWSLAANAALEAGGHDARVDHRTLEEQGIDRVPGVHRGPVGHMEARGIETAFISRSLEDFDAAERELAGEAELKAAAEAAEREAAVARATAEREEAARREAAARQAEAEREASAKLRRGLEAAFGADEAGRAAAGDADDALREEAARAEAEQLERQAAAEREAAEAEREAEQQAMAAEAEIAAAAKAAALRAVKAGTHLPKVDPGTWAPGSAPEAEREEAWKKDRGWLTHDWWRAAGRAVWDELIRPTAERLWGAVAAPAPDPTPAASSPSPTDPPAPPTAPAAPSPFGDEYARLQRDEQRRAAEDLAPAPAPPAPKGDEHARQRDTQRREAEEARSEPAPTPLSPREALTALLTTHGVQALSAGYAGHGGAGDVLRVGIDPPGCLPDAQLREVRDLAWAVVQEATPGFEQGDGGRGTLEWTPTREIQLEHVVFDTPAAEADSERRPEADDDSTSFDM